MNGYIDITTVIDEIIEKVTTGYNEGNRDGPWYVEDSYSKFEYIFNLHKPIVFETSIALDGLDVKCRVTPDFYYGVKEGIYVIQSEKFSIAVTRDSNVLLGILT